MLPDFPTGFLPLAALYPEIHYRFRALPLSRYFRRQPEIVADVPRRLDPGEALPVLLIVKDADRFPVTLVNAQVEAVANDRHISRTIQFDRELVKQRWWHWILWINLPDEAPCRWEVNVIWTVEIKGKIATITNDNYAVTSRLLTVNQPGERIPREDGWILGDLHVHTAFTEDQVEFGAPLSAYPALGKVAGFSFAMAADHSYDLDDFPGSFIESDPQLTRFKARAVQIARLNAEHETDFCILPGYELSVGNSKRRNVHLLLLNQSNFLPGSGDAAERWLETKPELSIGEAIHQMDGDAIAIAAHPMAKTPLLQKLLLHRGDWEEQDFQHEELTGLQIWNGINNGELQRGVKRWVGGLLEGRRWKIYAGSDAHGNFNRHIKVAKPMLTLAECPNQRFGEVWTGVQMPGACNANDLINALASKPSVISNGPFAAVEKTRSNKESHEVQVRVSSSAEFGALSKVVAYAGKTGWESENIFLKERLTGGYQQEYNLAMPEAADYVRVEVATDTGRRAYTNPLYLNGSA